MEKMYEKLFEKMCLIRCTEQNLLDLFSQGLLRGTVHTCIGQEACAVGTVEALDIKKDIIFSNHRGHGHYIAYSGDVFGLLAEIMGLESGVCSGVGGSQHVQYRNFFTNGIQGAGVPITAGMALAEKLKGSEAISVAFIGDGTFGQGVLYEAMNIASLWKLPVLIVVEHNQFAQSTPSYDQHAGVLENRASAFGIPVTVVDGMNVVDVYSAACDVVYKVRQHKSPQMLFLNTYRFGPHSKGDDFRDADEIERHRKRDPIVLLSQLLEDGVAENIEKNVIKKVGKIISELTGER